VRPDHISTLSFNYVPVHPRRGAQASEPKERKAGFELWAEFNPTHRCTVGADTGKGNGGDDGVSVLLMAFLAY